MTERWSPWPGMFPVLFQEGPRLLAVQIWDADASKATVTDDLSRLLNEDEPVKIHFGTPDEIAAFIRTKSSDHVILIGLEGTSATTQAAFAAAFADDPVLTVRVS